MPNYSVTADQIDNLLPQTQCRECGYDGCLPYAKAIVNHGESIAKCAPGGVEVLEKLGVLLSIPIGKYIAEVDARQTPKQLAVIREAECIGCTKCLEACPVDAIAGAAKAMHIVINDECTGCALCVAPCPVDCIDLIAVVDLNYDPETARRRYYAKERRKQDTLAQKNLDSLRKIAMGDVVVDPKAAKKAAIALSVKRVKEKKENI